MQLVYVKLLWSNYCKTADVVVSMSLNEYNLINKRKARSFLVKKMINLIM